MASMADDFESFELIVDSVSTLARAVGTEYLDARVLVHADLIGHRGDKESTLKRVVGEIACFVTSGRAA